MNRIAKIVVVIGMLAVFVWFLVHQAYGYYTQFTSEGISPVQSGLYAAGLVGVFVLLANLLTQGSVFNFMLFSDLFNSIVRAM